MNREVFLKNLATLGPVGYLPYAPGTWGSAAGALFVFLLRPSAAAHLLAIGAGIIVGILASNAAERVTGESDSGHIVIDEFVGMLVSSLLLPEALGYLLASFILFRIFDILKPLMIRKLERTLSRGAGVMADDILAGVYVNIVLQLWRMVGP